MARGFLLGRFALWSCASRGGKAAHSEAVQMKSEGPMPPHLHRNLQRQRLLLRGHFMPLFDRAVPLKG